jgi:hypothetical protein
LSLVVKHQQYQQMRFLAPRLGDVAKYLINR